MDLKKWEVRLLEDYWEDQILHFCHPPSNPLSSLAASLTQFRPSFPRLASLAARSG
jgi:hypothetical protein